MTIREQIDDIICNHRQAMDVDLPSDVVWQGIRKGMHEPRIDWYRKPARWAAAAALVLCAGALGWWLAPGIQGGGAARVDLYEFAPELQEAEVHFSSDVRALRKEVQDLLPPSSEQDPTLFLDDLETAYEDLRKNALQSGLTEEVIHAMINNYRLRIFLLEKLIVDLRRLEDQSQTIPAKEKSNTHEDSQYSS